MTICKRHMLYFGVYLLYSLKYVGANRNLINKGNENNNAYYFINTFTNSLTIPLALIRLSEPYVLHQFRKTMRKMFCKYIKPLYGEDEKVSKIQEESLYSFLNSSLNIEYVYLILKSIILLNNKEERWEDTQIARRSTHIKHGKEIVFNEMDMLT